MPKVKKMPSLDEMPMDEGMEMMANPLKKRKKTKMRAPVLSSKAKRKRK